MEAIPLFDNMLSLFLTFVALDLYSVAYYTLFESLVFVLSDDISSSLSSFKDLKNSFPLLENSTFVLPSS